MADQCINPNPDISGIGIRFNFYITILVAIFIRENDYTEELLSGAYKNAIFISLGILFNAIIQTFQKKLDLYHAILVVYILFFFNIVFLFGQRKLVWSGQTTNFQMFIYRLMHAFGAIAFFIWFLYVVIDGNKFGSQSSCNHLVEFVLIFHNVKVTEKWFRVMMIVFFAAQFIKACTNSLQNLFGESPKLGLARYVIGIPPAVCIIVDFELIIHHNRSSIKPGENEWGFGQTIAVILTFGIFIDIVTVIRELYRRKYHSPFPRSSPPPSNPEG